ncbi:hypothetical protein LWC33_05460 [Pseudonocardia sp. RS11V-5]|nr:hypothetical protein [Pseudonocardia terrae]MCE3550903.1 hypothetical protein [Pseudonocardia terrae]
MTTPGSTGTPVGSRLRCSSSTISDACRYRRSEAAAARSASSWRRAWAVVSAMCTTRPRTVPSAWCVGKNV